MKPILTSIYYWRAFRKVRKRGANVMLSRGGAIIRPEEMSLGNNIFISRNFHISARNLVLGNNIMVGPNLVIECDDHVYGVLGQTMFAVAQTRKHGEGVTLEDDLWIGANVTILRNAVIREGSVIGAGSVVTQDMPPYCICGGVPCRPIKTRFSLEQIGEHLEKVGSKYTKDDICQMWRDAGVVK